MGITGEADWLGKFYLYEVEVYVGNEGRVVTNLVADPYSVSLSTNSLRSQIVDLSDSSLAPDSWGTLTKPEFAHPTDMVLYELHVRDFSAIDGTVPAEFTGDICGVWGDRKCRHEPFTQFRRGGINPRPPAPYLRHRHHQRKQSQSGQK